MRVEEYGIDVTLTPRFVESLHEHMAAHLEMMRDADTGNEDQWAYGVCTVKSLHEHGGLVFQYGPEGEKPKGMKGETAVVF